LRHERPVANRIITMSAFHSEAAIARQISHVRKVPNSGRPKSGSRRARDSDRSNRKSDGISSLHPCGCGKYQAKAANHRHSLVPKPKGVATITRAPGHTDEKLVKSVARAHAWLADLTAGRYACVEDLAAAANINPKVVRQGLRLAFLPPELTMSVLNGEATMALKDIPKTLPLPWAVQREVIG
jgi:hypothetical protein